MYVLLRGNPIWLDYSASPVVNGRYQISRVMELHLPDRVARPFASHISIKPGCIEVDILLFLSISQKHLHCPKR